MIPSAAGTGSNPVLGRCEGITLCNCACPVTTSLESHLQYFPFCSLGSVGVDASSPSFGKAESWGREKGGKWAL